MVIAIFNNVFDIVRNFFYYLSWWQITQTNCSQIKQIKQIKPFTVLLIFDFIPQSIGPCFMDTTPPDFSGSISVTHSNGTIIARWNSGAFSDPQEPYQLQLEFAIGEFYYLLLSIILSISIINDTDYVLLG